MSLLGFDEFKWRAMTTAINQIKRPSRMLQDLIFGNRNTNESEYIDVDVVIGGRKIAPFVSPIQGGVVIAIAEEMSVPIDFVGLGEQIDDLKPFDPLSYVEALFE